MEISTDTPTPYTIADHPKATRSIEMIRAWAALAACAMAVLLSMQQGVLLFDAVLRGLAAGAAAFIIAWGVAVMVWREVVRAELLRVRGELRERRQAAQEAMIEARKAAAERAAER